MNSDNECSICLDNIEEKNKYSLQCNHIFHKECISKLLYNSCPLCRKGFTFTDDDLENRIFVIDGYLYPSWFSSTKSIWPLLIKSKKIIFTIKSVKENDHIYFKLLWNNNECFFDFVDDLRESVKTNYISFINIGRFNRYPQCCGYQGREENVGIRIKPLKGQENIIEMCKKTVNDYLFQIKRTSNLSFN